MKKLRMDLGALQVEPFDVLPAGPERKGTVAGQDGGAVTEPWRCSIDSQCYANTCGSGSCDTGNPCVACLIQK